MKKNYVCALLFAALLLSFPSCKQPDGASGEAEVYNPDPFGWRTASLSPFTVNNPVKAFAFGKGLYVAAGWNGVIAYSYDGDVWERARKAPDPASGLPVVEPFKLANGENADFNAVAFGGGAFIAVAAGGHIAYSYDGVYWTGVHGVGGFGSENINGIAYGEGRFVAVGDNGNVSVASQAAPGSWMGGKVSSFSALKDVAFGNGKFYAAGDDGWMGWASPSFIPANQWEWHPRQWTFSAQAGTFTPYVKKMAFGEYGLGTPGLGITFNEWSGKRIAVCSVGLFESADSTIWSAAWDSDIDASFFDKELNGIVWSPWDKGTWLAAGTSAMIGYWPSSDPEDPVERYWRALYFTEFRWWEITALAALNGRYFIGGIGGKIGYSK